MTMCGPSAPGVINGPFSLTAIIQDGQSLGIGIGGFPNAGIAPSGGGVKLFDPANLYTGTSGVYFLPLQEQLKQTVGFGDYPGNVDGETGMTAMGIQLETFANATGGKFDIAATDVAIANKTLAQISNPSNSWTSMLYEVTTNMGLAAQAGRKFGVGAIVMINGEADVTNVNFATDLATFLANANTALQAITGQALSIPMFLTQTNSGNQMVSQIQQNLAAINNPTSIFEVGPKYQYGYAGDGQHLSPASQYVLVAEKTAQAIYAWWSGNNGAHPLGSGVWTPLRPKAGGITHVSNVITCVFDIMFPPLQFSTLAPNHQTVNTQWAAGRGLEVSDAGGPVTITGVAITAPDTLQITCAAPLGASPMLSCAWTADNPTGHHGGTTDGQRSQIMDSDTTPLNHGAQNNYCVTFNLPIA